MLNDKLKSEHKSLKQNINLITFKSDRFVLLFQFLTITSLLLLPIILIYIITISYYYKERFIMIISSTIITILLIINISYLTYRIKQGLKLSGYEIANKKVIIKNIFIMSHIDKISISDILEITEKRLLIDKIANKKTSSLAIKCKNNNKTITYYLMYLNNSTQIKALINQLRKNETSISNY